MGILTQQTGDVAQLTIDARVGGKDGVNCFSKSLTTAKELLHTKHIVGHEIAILPGGSLSIGTAHLEGVKGGVPVTITALAAEEAAVAIEHIGVVHGALVVSSGNLCLAHRLGHAGDAPVVIGIL